MRFLDSKIVNQSPFIETWLLESNAHEVYWKNCLDINDDFFKKCYYRKIVKCFDTKLAEFNFKI